MSRRTFIAIGIALVAVGAAVRVNNALYFPLMRGYDAFAHFTYVWFLAEYARVPLATAGWEFFQPPGYYATVAAFWTGLSETDAIVRLRVATAFIALLGLTPAFVAWRILGRSFPEERTAQLLGIGLILFIPVHLYSSGFVGNEGLGAAVCGLCFFTLMQTLERESVGRAAALGVTLGAAMLIKFTGLVLVATAFATLGLRMLVRRDYARGIRTLSIVATVTLVVCGWFYVRNVMVYGNPFQMSREELFLAHIENTQTQGERGILEYVLFDPVILYRPQWPRDAPLAGGRPKGVEYSPLKESIPTGLYANTWFDGFGGFVLPRVSRDEFVRRAGQSLMTLGLIPTLMMAAGMFFGVRRLIRHGWDDTIVTMLFATAAMIAVIVQGTRTVPTQAAVKATYLMPISVAFAYWFASGAIHLTAGRPRRMQAIAGVSTLTALISVATFSHGWVVDNDWMTDNGGGPAFRNLHGVIYYAAGQRTEARRQFEWAAEKELPLPQENLADLALSEQRRLEALYRLRHATMLQERRLAKVDGYRKLYVEATLAEYANSTAVVLYELGWREEAEPWLARTHELSSEIPEADFNSGIAELTRALDATDDDSRRQLLDAARDSFSAGLAKDGNFFEALAMRGVARALSGDCKTGAVEIREGLADHSGRHRFYPLETGPGDLFSAGLHRRRRIEPIPPPLAPRTVLAGHCGGEGA